MGEGKETLAHTVCVSAKFPWCIFSLATHESLGVRPCIGVRDAMSCVVNEMRLGTQTWKPFQKPFGFQFFEVSLL